MYAPLYEALIKYSNENIPFHMPGHKFGKFADMKSLDLTALDATEASGLDNLYEAEGIIRLAMDELSRFYGSEDTIMLTNGSTSGILASILAICKEGDELLIARNCHHSVWHGLILAGVKPIYINPEYDEEKGMLTRISPLSVKEQLAKNPYIKGMLMVSPTYEGITSDIKEIADILHKEEKVLIVDEAHGAHFQISEAFPKSALQLDADIVIHSMHKTLPTLTQSALLHIGSNRVKREALIKSLRMIQTSSPSYMMMGTMDYVRSYIEENIEYIVEGYIKPLQELRVALSKMKHLVIIEDTHNAYDISKVIISTKDSNYDGYTLAHILEKDYRIISEAASANYIILMTMMADTKETLTKLEEALIIIDSNLGEKEEVEIKDPYKIFEKCSESKTISPRKAYYEDSLLMPIRECEGRISIESIMMYPPGVPIICIGEMITRDHIELIEEWSHKLKGIYQNNHEILCKVINDRLE